MIDPLEQERVMSEHEHNMKATGDYYSPLECDGCDFALSSNGLEELYLSEKAAVVRMNQAEDAMARMMDEKESLEARLSKMEEALQKIHRTTMRADGFVPQRHHFTHGLAEEALAGESSDE